MKVIFGASGFAKEVYSILIRIFTEKVDIECFVCADQDSEVAGRIHGIPVISESDFFVRYAGHQIEAYVAVGAPSLKQKIVKKIRAWNPAVDFPSLVDPNAVVDIAGTVVLAKEGVIVCAGVVTTIDINIDEFAVININCTVGHDVRIGAFSTISPGVNISGNVNIGDRTFLGAGVIILENIAIANDAVVGAGAVVVSNINEPGVYIGIPAKLKEFR